MLENLYNYLSKINFMTIYNDAAQPWQLGFQDSAAPSFTGIVELHNTISFYLIVICMVVFWIIFTTTYAYETNNNPIVHKYMNHSTNVLMHKNSNLIFSIKKIFNKRSYSTVPDNFSHTLCAERDKDKNISRCQNCTLNQFSY